MARALLVLRMLAMASTAWGYADELLKQDGPENRCARRLGPAEAHIMNRPQVGGVEPVVTFGGKGCGVNYRDGEALTVEVIAALATRCPSVASSAVVLAAPASASAPNRACRPFALPLSHAGTAAL